MQDTRSKPCRHDMLQIQTVIACTFVPMNALPREILCAGSDEKKESSRMVQRSLYCDCNFFGRVNPVSLLKLERGRDAISRDVSASISGLYLFHDVITGNASGPNSGISVQGFIMRISTTFPGHMGTIKL